MLTLTFSTPVGQLVSREYVTRLMVELPTRPLSNIIPNPQEKVLPKPKWHFGIRSRSPPMEVMLEIYKSLGQLGMEWKRKEVIEWPEIGVCPQGGYGPDVDKVFDQYKENHGAEYQMGRRRRPDKKTEGAEEKLAQALFVVETRHRYGNVMVCLVWHVCADSLGTNGSPAIPSGQREFPGGFQKHWILPRQRERDADSRSWFWIIVKSIG